LSQITEPKTQFISNNIKKKKKDSEWNDEFISTKGKKKKKKTLKASEIKLTMIAKSIK